MCDLSGAFFIFPESWARLLILPGFPHLGNFCTWSPGKGSGTRDVLSPPGQLRAPFLTFLVFWCSRSDLSPCPACLCSVILPELVDAPQERSWIPLIPFQELEQHPHGPRGGRGSLSLLSPFQGLGPEKQNSWSKAPGTHPVPEQARSEMPSLGWV